MVYLLEPSKRDSWFMDTYRQIEQIAGQYGVRVEEKGPGHYQIHGPLLVHYWPHSRNRTAYVNNTRTKKTEVSPAEAVKMAVTLPPFEKLKGRRKSTLHARKRKRWIKDRGVCHWCGDPVTEENATIDHVIPLGRGGIDNCANMVLACRDCNEWRGHDMPEIAEKCLQTTTA